MISYHTSSAFSVLVSICCAVFYFLVGIARLLGFVLFSFVLISIICFCFCSRCSLLGVVLTGAAFDLPLFALLWFALLFLYVLHGVDWIDWFGLAGNCRGGQVAMMSGHLAN